jgi:hypothetical protein
LERYLNFDSCIDEYCLFAGGNTIRLLRDNNDGGDDNLFVECDRTMVGMFINNLRLPQTKTGRVWTGILDLSLKRGLHLFNQDIE